MSPLFVCYTVRFYAEKFAYFFSVIEAPQWVELKQKFPCNVEREIKLASVGNFVKLIMLQNSTSAKYRHDMVAHPKDHHGAKRGQHDQIHKAYSELRFDIIWQGCVLWRIFLVHRTFLAPWICNIFWQIAVIWSSALENTEGYERCHLLGVKGIYGSSKKLNYPGQTPMHSNILKIQDGVATGEELSCQLRF